MLFRSGDQGRRKTKQARSRVLAKASEALAEKRYESFALPAAVKQLFQKPTDERSWKNAETLRGIVRRHAELAETLLLESGEDVRRLADALAAGGAPSRDVVGGSREVLVAGVPLWKGTRVSVPKTTRAQLAPAEEKDAVRPRGRKHGGKAADPTVEEQVRRIIPGPASLVEVRRRPRFGVDAEAVAIGDLAELIWDERPLRVAAKEWRSGRNEDEPLLVGETVDGLLTQLGLLLWHEQAERWARSGRAWTEPEQINEATRWYLMGQRAGDAPLFDGRCSRCGDLLFGALKQSGNKKNGAPRNEEGKPCTRQQQPPFLLRHSPKFLAQEAPAVFEWSEETSRLALRAEHRAQPPWRIRSGTRAKAAQEKDWLYCGPCHDFLFSDDPKTPVPLRDETSARRMRPDPKQQAREAENASKAAEQQDGQRTPTAAAAAGTAAAAAATTATPATPGAAEERAASYRKKWEQARDEYARAPGGAFEMGNLVPTPRPELWQDAPHSPLNLLTSPQAQGRLAVCQLVSSMEESRLNVGVATYASATGDVSFRRRSAAGPPLDGSRVPGPQPGSAQSAARGRDARQRHGIG